MVPARRWLVVAVVCAVAVCFLAVCTIPGQELENAALRGADQAAARDQGLGRIIVFLVLGTVLIGASPAGAGYAETVWDNTWAGYSFASAGAIAAAPVFLVTWRRPEVA